MNNSFDKDIHSKVISESQLVSSLGEHLIEEGYRVSFEVSNMSQSIDVVATKNRQITAIEAKRSNWKRALNQCKAHTLVADYIVIAMSMKRTPIELRDILDSNGWGLLMYNLANDEWNWEIYPKKNKLIWLPQRHRFSANLKKVHYATRTLDDV